MPVSEPVPLGSMKNPSGIFLKVGGDFNGIDPGERGTAGDRS